jgi:hypothetical protein
MEAFGRLVFGTPDFPTAKLQMQMVVFHGWLPKAAAGWG